MEENTQKELKCIRYLTGEMAGDESSVFEIELSLDEDLFHLFERYKMIWNNYPDYELHQMNAIHDVVPFFGNFSKKYFNYKKLLPAIAAIFIIAVSSFYFSQDVDLGTTKISTSKGERKHLLLPDSSVVVLNANSSIEYPNSFSDLREVLLTGEAFFMVQKDKQHPFIVHNKDFEVRVLGTSFSVNGYNDQKKVSLKEGGVEVLLKLNRDKITLNPDEQVLWDIITGEVLKRNFEAYKEFDWIDNLLILDNNLLNEALEKINRFYGVYFLIQDDDVGNQRITGIFKEQDLDEFIASLEFITDVEIVPLSDNEFLIKAIEK